MRVLRYALLALALLPATAHAQAPHTWISGVGDDANPCSRTAPCKTLSLTIAKTHDGGEIGILDPTAFLNGQVGLTVTKGITVNANGRSATFIGNASVPAMVINAPGKDVSIRGLTIRTDCDAQSTQGILIQDARSVTLHDLRLSGFSQNAILVSPTTADTKVYIDDSRISSACTAFGNGIQIAPAATRTASVFVDGVSVTNLATALLADGAGAAAYLARSSLYGNATNLSAVNGATITDVGANTVAANTAARRSRKQKTTRRSAR